MKERLATGLAKILKSLGAGKLASGVLSFGVVKENHEAAQAAIEAMRAARAATDAATAALNAATAALNAASATGTPTPVVVGTPGSDWTASPAPAPECPSQADKAGRKFRRLKGWISPRR